MKILIISWYFPPSNTIGAVRVGNLAKYLISHGHDVRVVTAKDPPYQQSLAIEYPEGHVEYARWIDVNALPKAIALAIKWRQRRRAAPLPPSTKLYSADTPVTGTNRLTGAMHWFASVYLDAVSWPDSKIGWLSF